MSLTWVYHFIYLGSKESIDFVILVNSLYQTLIMQDST